jgi:di/tricarboxylate transporter
MIMFNIAEWIANVLVLGLGVFFWTLAIAVMFLIITEFINQVQK